MLRPVPAPISSTSPRAVRERLAARVRKARLLAALHDEAVVDEGAEAIHAAEGTPASRRAASGFDTLAACCSPSVMP